MSRSRPPAEEYWDGSSSGERMAGPVRFGRCPMLPERRHAGLFAKEVSILEMISGICDCARILHRDVRAVSALFRCCEFDGAFPLHNFELPDRSAGGPALESLSWRPSPSPPLDI